jgi:hypothetical protein
MMEIRNWHFISGVNREILGGSGKQENICSFIVLLVEDVGHMLAALCFPPLIFIKVLFWPYFLEVAT